jgi:hypothetical protein
MTAKVCIAWAISAIALIISSALASPSNNVSSDSTLPNIEVVSATDDASEETEDQNDDAEEIED